MDRILKILAATILVAAVIIIAPPLCKSVYLLLNCLFWGDERPTEIEQVFSILLSLTVVFGLLGGIVTHWRTQKE